MTSAPRQSLPPDVEAWITKNFRPADAGLARASLEMAVDHKGELVNARLLRCAAVASRGELERLHLLVEELKKDWRDVIVAGEYDYVNEKSVRIRDLTRPIE